MDKSSNPNMVETSAMENLVSVFGVCLGLPLLFCSILVYELVLCPILFCSILVHDLILRPILFIADKLFHPEASAIGEHVDKPQER